MYISARERELIEILLDASEEITVKEVANRLEVSERTVHRDLKNIESIIQAHQLQLHKKTGVGLFIEGADADKDELRETVAASVYTDFSPQERKAIILTTLLQEKNPVKLFTLSKELNVTVATVSNDLDQLEKELERFHLLLVRKRGYGVTIKGSEENKRSSLSHLISSYIDPFAYVAQLKQNVKGNLHNRNIITNRLLGLVSSERLFVIEKVVENSRRELPYQLADSAIVGLIVHLALAIERLQKGEKIVFDPIHLQEIEDTKEYLIAKEMTKDLEAALQIEIPEDEVGYITMHLLGAKLHLNHRVNLGEEEPNIAYLTEVLIKYVLDEIGMELQERQELHQDLVAHLKPAIFRIRQQMQIHNPLIENIKQDYQDIFHIVQEGVQKVFPNLDFPDDEIGFLVLHFVSAYITNDQKKDLSALVICASGIGAAKILATRLKQRIPEINHIHNLSFFDIEKVQVDEYDVIVSTIPLERFEGDYVLASPILTKDEIHRIKRLIRRRRITSRTKEQKKVNNHREDSLVKLEFIHNYSHAMTELLTHLYVESVSGDTIEIVLENICERLEKRKIVTNHLKIHAKLLEREQYGGLGIPNTNLALYHTRASGVVKPSFSIHRLEQPLILLGMDGKEMEVTTILLMLSKVMEKQEVLEILSFISSLLVQKEEMIEQLSSGGEQEIKQFLANEFYQYLLKNIGLTNA